MVAMATAVAWTHDGPQRRRRRPRPSSSAAAFLLLMLVTAATAVASDSSTTTTGGGGGGGSGGGSSVKLMLESVKEIASCPGSFLRCMLSSPCRATMACAGHCVHGPIMNLTCFVPCTFGNDQHAFNSFTDCVMRAKPDPDDPGVESLPAQGQCLDVGAAVVKDFDPARLEGEWYVAAGASSLEAYDCQKNRVTRRNATHFQIDEYYQGYIEGLGFKWAQSRQVFHSLAPEGRPGLTAWRPADGASGYEAVYHTLASNEAYHIFYYCAPLRPTPLYWSSFLLYSRTPQPPAKAMKEIQGLLDRYGWTTPLVRVNHEGCDYRIADPDALHSSLPPATTTTTTNDDDQQQQQQQQASPPSWWRAHHLIPPLFASPAPSSPPPTTTTTDTEQQQQQPALPWWQQLYASLPSPSLAPLAANIRGWFIPPPGMEAPIVVRPEGEEVDEMGEL